MQHHGPSVLKGPKSRTRRWWANRPRYVTPCESTVPDDQEFAADGTKESRSEGGVRRELVERVRREIAQGTYETPEKWNVALGRLLGELEDRAD